MTDIFRFYGLDWLAILLSALAVLLLGGKNKWGFIAFIGANFTWIGLGILVLHSPAIVLGNILFLITNSRGFLKWNSAELSR